MYIHIFAPMKLEDAIKQSKFRTMKEKALINVLFTANFFTLEQNRLLKGFDISIQQFNILRILRGQHPRPASVKLLMERMLDKTSNASRLVEKLHNKALVKREPCEVDRRQVDVVITDKGLKLIEEASDAMDAMISDLSIPEEQAAQLSDLLDLSRQREA
jgi:DNA-binding MarR family transcriptional regulator